MMKKKTKGMEEKTRINRKKGIVGIKVVTDEQKDKREGKKKQKKKNDGLPDMKKKNEDRNIIMK